MYIGCIITTQYLCLIYFNRMFVQNTNFAFASFYIHYSNELHRLLTQRIDTPKSVTLSSKGYQIGNQPSTQKSYHEINQCYHWRYHEDILVDPEDRSRRKNWRINRINDGNNETWEECDERVNCFLEEKLDIGTNDIWI